MVRVEATSEQKRYEASHIADGDDFSWWIADDESQPQIVLLELERSVNVFASRIRFQKDSSTYTHKVEISIDGTSWEPVQIGKELKYMRLTIEKSSEGAAGLAEVTLYQ